MGIIKAATRREMPNNQTTKSKKVQQTTNPPAQSRKSNQSDLQLSVSHPNMRHARPHRASELLPRPRRRSLRSLRGSNHLAPLLLARLRLPLVLDAELEHLSGKKGQPESLRKSRSPVKRWAKLTFALTISHRPRSHHSHACRSARTSSSPHSRRRSRSRRHCICSAGTLALPICCAMSFHGRSSSSLRRRRVLLDSERPSTEAVRRRLEVLVELVRGVGEVVVLVVVGGSRESARRLVPVVVGAGAMGW